MLGGAGHAREAAFDELLVDGRPRVAAGLGLGDAYVAALKGMGHDGHGKNDTVASINAQLTLAGCGEGSLLAEGAEGAWALDEAQREAADRDRAAAARDRSEAAKELAEAHMERESAVSYTHLTLPTKRIV